MSITELTDLIRQYEQGKLSFEALNTRLLDENYSSVEKDYLENYWRSESIEDFVEILLVRPITDWALIDDARAVQLVEESVEHLGRGIFHRNIEALALRYQKTSEEVMDLFIDREPELTANEILTELKKDTVTRL